MFPATRHSIVRELSVSDDPERRARAFDAVVSSYWKPVYTYLRLGKRMEREDAEDLTQGFFTHAFEKGTLDGYDPVRARFRTWVRTCLDGFVRNELKAARRLKRGGSVTHVSLDFETAEGEIHHREIPVTDDLESFFHREWTRSLFASSVEEIRREAEASGRELELRIFERYDLEDSGARPTYSELAKELGTTASKVTNALHSMRGKLREKVLSKLRDISASEDEFRAEAKALFGVDRK